MPERGITRAQFLRVSALAGASATLAACGFGGPNQEVFERDVVRAGEAAQATQIAELSTKIPAALRQYISGFDRPYTADQVEITTPAPVNPAAPPSEAVINGESPAHAHARDQLNRIFNRHSETEDLAGINNEVDGWIGHFIQSWQDNGQTLISGDTNVLEATLPFVWNRNTRSQIIHIMADQRQKGIWEGHEPVTPELVDYALSVGARKWGYDAQAFKTQQQYEQTRNVVIETAARAKDARKKMYDLGLFANPDQAVCSIGTLVPLSIWETGGYQSLGDNGPARQKKYNGESMQKYADYIVTVARENTGVNIPLTMEGSTAGAMGPQIMPPAFTAAINYVKEHAPNAKLNPFDMTDGMIFATIFLQQNMYNAEVDSTAFVNDPQNPRGPFWYYSNNDTHDGMLSVMGHWNPEINQMNYLTNSFFDYKNRFGSPVARTMNRRQMLAASLGFLTRV